MLGYSDFAIVPTDWFGRLSLLLLVDFSQLHLQAMHTIECSIFVFDYSKVGKTATWLSNANVMRTGFPFHEHYNLLRNCNTFFGNKYSHKNNDESECSFGSKNELLYNKWQYVMDFLSDDDASTHKRTGECDCHNWKTEFKLTELRWTIFHTTFTIFEFISCLCWNYLHCTHRIKCENEK